MHVVFVEVSDVLLLRQDDEGPEGLFVLEVVRGLELLFEGGARFDGQVDRLLKRSDPFEPVAPLHVEVHEDAVRVAVYGGSAVVFLHEALGAQDQVSSCGGGGRRERLQVDGAGARAHLSVQGVGGDLVRELQPVEHRLGEVVVEVAAREHGVLAHLDPSHGERVGVDLAHLSGQLPVLPGLNELMQHALARGLSSAEELLEDAREHPLATVGELREATYALLDALFVLAGHVVGDVDVLDPGEVVVLGVQHDRVV